MKKLLTLFLLLGSITCLATPVNVNTADATTLADALHGIGLKKAQDIVAYREANGPFKSLEELGNVKGVGDKTLAKNQADILFTGTGAAPVAAKATKAKTAPAAIPAPAVAVPAVSAPAAEVAKARKVKAAPVPATPEAAPAAIAPATAAPAASAPEVVKKPKKVKKAKVDKAAAVIPAAAPTVPAPAANPLK
ncbi:MAG: helix-hairpin-helix domain-containing protein [Methylococcaceae bacterium]|nr:helix-hairpin-helix domain-containing protein [Methylococcaceae bacterium]